MKEGIQRKAPKGPPLLRLQGFSVSVLGSSQDIPQALDGPTRPSGTPTSTSAPQQSSGMATVRPPGVGERGRDGAIPEMDATKWPPPSLETMTSSTSYVRCPIVAGILTMGTEDETRGALRGDPSSEDRPAETSHKEGERVRGTKRFQAIGAIGEALENVLISPASVRLQPGRLWRQRPPGRGTSAGRLASDAPASIRGVA